MIPPTLEANPVLSQWVSIEPGGQIRVAFGKVEYGQGNVTALAQIAAEELDVPFEKLKVINAATDAVPNEGLTVGSMSIETSGASVRAACAEVRALFVAEAARRANCQPEDIDIVAGAFIASGKDTGENWWTLADAVDLDCAPTGKARWKTADQHRLIGKSVPRLDLPSKVFGGGFIQDLALPGMRHARILRQPGPKARLVSIDAAAARKAAGDDDLDILIDGSFVAFISTSERAAAAAHAAAALTVRWNNPRSIDESHGEAGHLKSLPDVNVTVGDAEAPSNRRKFSATFTRPYISHGSLSPSCGIALFNGERLHVWTHAQGVYPMQAVLSRVTGLGENKIDVEHVQGAGTYGNNGADDAACDAAVVAMRRPGKTVRVQWRREDEFGYAPVGTAMQIELAAELDDDGRLVDWTNEIWSGPHPNRGRSLAELALPAADTGQPETQTPPDNSMLMRFSGGRLNAVPAYDIAASRVREHLIRSTPVKVSSLRGLGGPPNIFAAECFVDELAEVAGKDPVEYRLDMLSDTRARAVLARVAENANWARRTAMAPGYGLGVAYDRHRDRGAYCAVICELHVDQEVRLDHLWCVADCGLIINPDGARNQLEGGMVMAASWTLKEQVKLGGTGITSVTWGDYPILRFDEVPPIDVEMITVPGAAPWGTGEISQGGTMAAIGNALSQALGVRIRDMPFTRERISTALLKE
ncbi:MAG TPA: molybdopterin cofactor-binding domain-containing protein [Pseudomonadales bacterium]|nr:molybdopterin cofactor-binding domain-containing protein [Pseudomonadales bacterium]